MRTVDNLAEIRKTGRPIVLAAGFFDGVHKGHQKVLESARAKALECGGQAWVLTFDVHPLQVLNPRKKPPLITGTGHKLRIFDEMNMDGCILYPFRKSTSMMPAKDFLLELRDGIRPLQEIVVGRNWKFGKGGKGTTRLLASLCRNMDVKLDVISPVIRGGAPVSSTRIRKLIICGDIKGAAGMLGRPVSVLGRVVKGRSMARGLGFPTANLETADEVLPPFGVYAVVVNIDKKPFSGVLNFGIRPTFSRGSVSRPVMELHVINYNGDLYGRDLHVLFVEKLRNEKRFASPEELRSQIDLDVRLAKAVLGCKG